MRKILYTGCTMSEEDIEKYYSLGYDVKATKPLCEEDLIKEVKGMDILIPGGEEQVNRKVLESAKDTLRMVAFHGVGYEYYVDVKSAREFGITVTNVPDKNSTAVSEFTAAVIGTAMKRIAYISNTTKSGIWTKHMTLDIADMTIGIVGMGNIGKKVARIMNKGFGSKIVYNSHSRKPDVEEEFDAEFMDLHELCKVSDVVTIHLPFTNETEGLIDSVCIEEMKESALLVNTSRAEIVSSDALYDGLVNDKIRCAAMDCYYTGRIPVEGDTFGFTKLSDDKFILTPHVAYWSPNALRAVQDTIMDNIFKVMNGEDCENIVN